MVSRNNISELSFLIALEIFKICMIILGKQKNQRIMDEKKSIGK